MRLLFLNPPEKQGRIYMKEIGRCGRLAAAGEVWPQTGLAYLAAVAEQGGAQAEVCDAMAMGWTTAQTAKFIEEWAPDSLFVHLATPTYNSDKEFCTALTERLQSLLLVVLGGHVSAVGGQVLSDFPADYAIIGEAETPIRELVRMGGFRFRTEEMDHSVPLFEEMGKGRNKEHGDIHEMPPGFYWLTLEGKLQNSGPSPLVTDLDALPHPARQSLPNRRYKMPFFGREPFATIISSRGCPYACSFCRAGLTWGKKVRGRSTESVLQEMKMIRDDYGIRNVVFMTDSFTFDRAWVISLCELIIESDDDFRWICNSRVDAVDEEMLTLMKQAGCLLISYGLESGSQKILDSCRKKITLEQSRNAIELTKKVGIMAFAYFIFGLPAEDWDSVQATIAFALDIEPDYALFHVATPFPGTDLYNEVKEKDLLLNEDWDLCDEASTGILRTEFLSPEDLRKARSMAGRKFYLRPRRILKELKYMKSPGQWISRSKAAWDLLSGWLSAPHECGDWTEHERKTL